MNSTEFEQSTAGIIARNTARISDLTELYAHEELTGWTNPYYSKGYVFREINKCCQSIIYTTSNQYPFNKEKSLELLNS